MRNYWRSLFRRVGFAMVADPRVRLGDGGSVDWLQLCAMVSRISHTTVDCLHAFELSEWWKQLVGYADVPGDPNEAGDEECTIVDAATGHSLLFIEVPDDKSIKNRIHFDLSPTDRRRDEEIDRVMALGARQVADHRKPDGAGWMVLADPEGNEFCIVRSDAERESHV
jgi:Glyoxalase-like domain